MAETDTTDPDLTQVIEDLAHQTYHVHCRVGYDHGPQVFFDLFRAVVTWNAGAGGRTEGEEVTI